MKRIITTPMLFFFLPFLSFSQTNPVPVLIRNDNCDICTSEMSYADTLLEYTPGCPLADPDPTGALGACDYEGATVDGPEFVFLGQGGVLKLGFTDNLLANSGDATEDLWIFEVGPGIEACNIALRPFDSYTLAQIQQLGLPDNDGDGFFEIGGIGGSTSGIDIDEIMPGYAPGTLKFDAVEITDVVDDSCWGGTPGADIDAVCALRSISLDSSEAPLRQPELFVFPNPFYAQTRLEIRGGGQEEWVCEVHDVRGIWLRAEVFRESLDLDLKGLPPGMYTLSVKSGSWYFIRKVIKAD